MNKITLPLFDKCHTLTYDYFMRNPVYEFSAEKNQLLIKGRNISFEAIISALDNGQLLDIVKHPNPNKYPKQNMFVVYANNQVYLVPFIEKDQHTIFLKTIFPSRKAKKQYLTSEVANASQKANKKN